jgi:TatD DNase family protein
MLIDSHVHLDVPQFDEDREAVIGRARAAGVDLMLEIAGSDIGSGSLARGLQLAETYPFIYAAVGLHPHEATLYDASLEATLLAASRHPKVIGWGEIGLDFHYDHSPRDLQQRVFRRQLELARSANLPPIIHTREAEEETIAILDDVWSDPDARASGGVFHCFTGSPALAEAALARGFLLSFSGIVTFRTATVLQEIAATIPPEQFLIETDCPYLAPVPHRGRRNEPAFVRDTAIFLAHLRGVSPEELFATTTHNFRRLFRLPTLEGAPSTC